MRVPAILLTGLVVLAACGPRDPAPVQTGVGFNQYTEYEAESIIREAELTGRPVPDDLIIASPSDSQIVDLNNPEISDEQDFEAVSARETIESDAERRQRQQEAYRVIAPTALPDRPDSGRPNIVDFALSTTNAVGQPVYRRGSVSQSRYDRACAAYATADLAQEDFLRSGGPERDRKDLDPDGDGFACAWDPTPFRAARTAAQRG
ncbi:MAG: hypothetical protein AAFR35_05125 [Pseudomonadota bacterium]